MWVELPEGANMRELYAKWEKRRHEGHSFVWWLNFHGHGATVEVSEVFDLPQ